MTKNEMKDKISMALKDPILQMGFEVICSKLSRLEKENAELKEQCSILTDCNISMALKDPIFENVEMQKQLIKAKELLTRFVMASVYFNGKETDLVEEAEKFLKEPKEIEENEN